VHALLYDIHGNLPALEAVLGDAEAAGAQSFVLGGDYAFAGAWPSETVAVLRELDALWIRGNGERWTADVDAAPDQDFVRRALAYAAEMLGDGLVSELDALPAQAEVDGVLFCHGSPRSDVETFAPEPVAGEEGLLEDAEQPVVVFGHSHVQFRRQGAGRLLVNPGSVGMPFDGDRRAGYALWRGNREFELRRVEYDFAAYVADLRSQLSDPLGDAVETLVRRIEQASFVD
jgi:diadenosine tetraphosphatase ApaH/serine/threonine PP2A family protein phosphatase